jgi:hypothetical protein
MQEVRQLDKWEEKFVEGSLSEYALNITTKLQNLMIKRTDYSMPTINLENLSYIYKDTNEQNLEDDRAMSKVKQSIINASRHTIVGTHGFVSRIPEFKINKEENAHKEFIKKKQSFVQETVAKTLETNENLPLQDKKRFEDELERELDALKRKLNDTKGQMQTTYLENNDIYKDIVNLREQIKVLF